MMKLFITQRHSRNRHGDWIDSLENNYVEYFQKKGVDLVLLSNVERDLAGLVKKMSPSAIILTGGGDVDPALYGGRLKNVNNLEISQMRDAIEADILRIAIKEKIPVLGICRGMQIINVFFNGKLSNLKGLDPHHPLPGPHKVSILDKRLSSVLGCTEVDVNSYHNFGVFNKEIGEGLVPFAGYSDNKLVEGLFHKDYPVAGIQWHPERQSSCGNLDSILVEALLNKKLFWEV